MKVDFSRRIGPFKRLNGINMGPIISNRYAHELTAGFYERMNCSAVRLHDVPLCNPGMNLVDVHQIFTNFNADPEDPQAYFFEQTDFYLEECRKLGLEVEYRLGESIEHCRRQYFTNPPADFDKWARICSHIVAHYNDGWANGYHWNLKYWVIWCEPNEPKLWTGTIDQYYDLYAVTSRRLKAEHPEIKVGGPAWGGATSQPQAIEAFLSFCESRKLPVDFIAYNSYSNSIKVQLEGPVQFKEMARNHGYPEAEIHLGEWHYLNRSWESLRLNDLKPAADDGIYGMKGFEAAAFTAAVLMGFEDTPMDLAFFYTGNAKLFGVLDDYLNPTKVFYALEAYGRLMNYGTRVQAEVGERLQQRHELYHTDQGDLRMLAGVDEAGNGAVLIAAFFNQMQQLTVEIPGSVGKQVTVRVIDKGKNLEDAVFDRRGEVLTLRKDSSSAVFLIECR